MARIPSKYILMLGWEFSPILAGGLGVVARSITENLTTIHGQRIYYVLPHIPEDTTLNFPGINFLNADVGNDPKNNDLLNKIYIDANLVSPYVSLSQGDIYKTENSSENSTQKSLKKSSKDIYGKELLKEVASYEERVPKIVEEKDIDIVHAHDWMTATAGANVKKHMDKPLIMHVHATEIERTIGNPHPIIFEKELRGMESSDVIIAVSHLTKQRIIDNYGIPADKIKVVHNAVDQIKKKFTDVSTNIHKDDQVVLFLARLTAMKGADYLLKAAQKVVKKNPKAKFVFVGGGELLEPLIEMSVELGIADRVTFTGFLPHKQVDRAYRYADVFIMPSIAEPFGITPLEAIRNGTPVIISKQSGVSEILQNVLKIDFWDIDKMAESILSILRFGVLAEELQNNSKRDLENIDWGLQSAKILDIYNEIKSVQRNI